MTNQSDIDAQSESALFQHWNAVLDRAWNALYDQADAFSFLIESKVSLLERELSFLSRHFSYQQIHLAEEKAEILRILRDGASGFKQREGAEDFVYRQYPILNGLLQAQFFESRDLLEAQILATPGALKDIFRKNTAYIREELDKLAADFRLPAGASERIKVAADQLSEAMHGILDCLYSRVTEQPQNAMDAAKEASDAFEKTLDNIFPRP